MKKVASRRNTETKSMKCVNSDPDNSKWGYVAPKGGCENVVNNVDANTTSVLCWQCTSKTTSTKM